MLTKNVINELIGRFETIKDMTLDLGGCLSLLLEELVCQIVVNSTLLLVRYVMLIVLNRAIFLSNYMTLILHT